MTTDPTPPKYDPTPEQRRAMTGEQLSHAEGVEVIDRIAQALDSAHSDILNKRQRGEPGWQHRSATAINEACERAAYRWAMEGRTVAPTPEATEPALPECGDLMRNGRTCVKFFGHRGRGDGDCWAPPPPEAMHGYADQRFDDPPAPPRLAEGTLAPLTLPSGLQLKLTTGGDRAFLERPGAGALGVGPEEYQAIADWFALAARQAR